MIEPASIFTVATSIGYPLLFVIVMIETGCGIPVAPGEIAVVTAAIAASEGKLSIELVIIVAAAAAIIGDNIGYFIGRKGGRWLLERPGPFLRQRTEALATADWFFDRHGPKAVFIGRWLPVLRVYASWLAGGSRMRWTSFVGWNAAGGIAWSLSIGLLGYFVGATAKSIINTVGVAGIPIVILGVLAAMTAVRRKGRRLTAEREAASPEPAVAAGPDAAVDAAVAAEPDPAVAAGPDPAVAVSSPGPEAGPVPAVKEMAAAEPTPDGTSVQVT